ncbi:MCE family protein [bacterium]|nr:MCE family protein [bacterium]
MDHQTQKSLTEVKVGLFVLVGLLILTFIVISVGDFHLYQKGYKINILFNRVEGLEVASPIRFSGMEVGEVKEMKVEGEKIKVVAWIRESASIKRDSRVTINSLGIVGEKYIEIVKSLSRARILRDGDTIVGVDPVSLGDLFYKTEKIILNLERTTGRIEETLHGSIKKADLGKIVKTTIDVLNNIDKVMNNFNTIITENRGNIKEVFISLDNSSKAILEAAKVTSSTIREIEKNITSLIKENKEDIKIACEEFKNTSILLKKKSTKISSDLEETLKNIGKNIDQTIKNIEENIGQITKNIGKNIDQITKNTEENIDQITKDISQPIKNIDQAIIKNKDKLDIILDNYQRSSQELTKAADALKNIMSKIEKGEGLLGKLTTNEKTAKDLDQIIQNLNKLSEDVKENPWKLLRK